MKPIKISLLPFLLATSATARVAQVYLSGLCNCKQLSDSHSQSVSASAARLVFAQRLGLAEYHSLGEADHATIRAVNDFGGRPHSLFVNDADQSRPKAMIVIEGVEHIDDINPHQSHGVISSFQIDNPPDQAATGRLLKDFTTQAAAYCFTRASDQAHLDEIVKKLNMPMQHTNDLSKYLTMYMARNSRLLAHSTALVEISHQYGATSNEYRSVAASLRESLSSLFETAVSADLDLMVLAMPSKVSGTNLFTRSLASSWGSYTLPDRQIQSSPEAADSSVDEPELGSGRPDYLPGALSHATNTEELTGLPVGDPGLEAEAQVESTYQASDDVANLPAPSGESLLEQAVDVVENIIDDIINEFGPASAKPAAPATAFQSENDSTPPLGILPACYSSQSACESATHFCSGHGKCRLAYTDSDAVGASSGECFACGCVATRRENDDGTYKTTRWAGPACQKVDVSMPFWLLGSVVVGLVGAASWGVSLLWAMGSTELPSVIGAGVAGPRPK